jgi:hypothetical protein
VYIYGLYLDGCAWSGRENKLVDSEPKKLYHPLPVLYVTGVQAKVRGRNQCLRLVTALLALISILAWSCVSQAAARQQATSLGSLTFLFDCHSVDRLCACSA